MTILNDILDFSKMEAGKVQIQHEPFDLHQTLDDIYHLFLISAKQKGLSLQIVKDEGMPIMLLGDGSRLRQVLSNLVGNAIKFTTEGAVEIRVRLLYENIQEAKIQFAVQDTGIGIDDTNKDKLFQRFSRFNNKWEPRAQGTGLGLAISKMLVELMNGSISFNSAIGEGSTFYVDLTFDKYDGVKTKHFSGSMMSRIDFAGCRLLLAEDDPTSAFMMQTFLKRYGIEVHHASDGAQAMEKADADVYDVILMDVNMPHVDGLEASRHIREQNIQDRQGKPVVIIAMTAYAMSGDREKCMNAGMDDYLSKPINFDLLLDRLSQYCLSAGASTVTAREAEGKQAENARDSMDSFALDGIMQALQTASGLDETTCIEVVKTYLDQSAEIVELIKRGDEVGKQLHKLKGSSGNVRAEAIMKLSQRAEKLFKIGDTNEVLMLVQEIETLLIDYQNAFSKRYEFML
jgi:CheY-like chemotaxis protein